MESENNVTIMRTGNCVNAAFAALSFSNETKKKIGGLFYLNSESVFCAGRMETIEKPSTSNM